MAMQIGTELDSPNFTRSMQYFDICQKYGSMFGVDPYIMVAKMAQESGGDPYVNADGLMQIIPYNGVWERTISARNVDGTMISFTITREGRQIPDDAIRWATMYVASLKVSVGDDMKATLAYNLGPGTVLWIKKHYPSAWDNGLEWTNYITQARNAVLGTGGDPLYLEHVMRYYAGDQYGAVNVEPPGLPVLKGTPTSSPYGYRIHPITGENTFHAGLDFDGSAGDPIFATQNARVIAVGWNDIMGWYISLEHTTDIYYSRYQHLIENPTLTVGTEVIKGQQIGRMGTTGSSTGTHLHFVIGLEYSGSWNDESNTMDPEKYLAMATAPYVPSANEHAVNGDGTMKTPDTEGDSTWGKNGKTKFKYFPESNSGEIVDANGDTLVSFNIINNVTNIGQEPWREYLDDPIYINAPGETLYYFKATKKDIAIRNVSGLMGMSGNGNYYLANDIDMQGMSFSPPPLFRGTLKTDKYLILNPYGAVFDEAINYDVGINYGATDRTDADGIDQIIIKSGVGDGLNYEEYDEEKWAEINTNLELITSKGHFRYESELDWSPYREGWGDNDGGGDPGDGGDGEKPLPVYVLDNGAWVQAKEVYLLDNGAWVKAKEVYGMNA